MSKFELKEKSVQLRKSGYSIGEIAKELYISKSTTSMWCRGIFLTDDQQNKLHWNS